mgnify:CR=1 FL=1
MLHIYNTLSRKKELFTPIEPGKAGLYVCGITIYDYCHVGHARTYVAFDVINRYLRFLGYDVTYVRNITDVDDKIIKRAAENNESCDALTERFTQAMHADFAALGLMPADIEPRVTTHMAEIIALIETLVAKGYAYVAPYAAAKHGVVGLTRSLAQEVAKRPVTVNALCPGFLDTEMTDRSIATISAKTGMDAAAARAALAGQSPQNRLIQPAEVTAAALFLCGAGAEGINGQAIAIAGGEP